MTTLKSEKVSIAELFRITGFDRHEISRKLAGAGVPYDLGPNRSHMYDKTMALAVLYNNPRAVHEDDAKRRKAVAEAEKAEITVEKLRGELVSADEMKQAAAELIKTLFQRVVRVEPAVIASRCVGLDAVGIETEIRTAMQGIFSDLRFDPSKYLEINDGEDENSETAAD
mgnify:CR=1 FL=1